MKLRQRKKNIRRFLVEKKKTWFGKGVQYIYHFNNGDIVSVMKFEVVLGAVRWGSYGAEAGLYELADICEGEVYGYLTEKEVIKRLEKVSKR